MVALNLIIRRHCRGHLQWIITFAFAINLKCRCKDALRSYCYRDDDSVMYGNKLVFGQGTKVTVDSSKYISISIVCTTLINLVNLQMTAKQSCLKMK